MRRKRVNPNVMNVFYLTFDYMTCENKNNEKSMNYKTLFTWHLHKKETRYAVRRLNAIYCL